MCTINRHLRFPQDVDENQDLANAPRRGLAKRKLRSKRASLSSWQKLWRTTFLGTPEMSCVQQFYRPSDQNLECNNFIGLRARISIESAKYGIVMNKLSPQNLFVPSLKSVRTILARYNLPLTRFEHARQTIFEDTECFYNRIRRHSSLGYVIPVVYEQLKS